MNLLKLFSQKRKFLKQFQKAYIYEIAKVEIDIELYGSMSDEQVVGQDTSGAEPKDMTAKDALKTSLVNHRIFTDRLNAVNNLLK